MTVHSEHRTGAKEPHRLPRATRPAALLPVAVRTRDVPSEDSDPVAGSHSAGLLLLWGISGVVPAPPYSTAHQFEHRLQLIFVYDIRTEAHTRRPKLPKEEEEANKERKFSKNTASIKIAYTGAQTRCNLPQGRKTGRQRTGWRTPGPAWSQTRGRYCPCPCHSSPACGS